MCGPYVAICAARLSPGGATPRLRAGLRLLFNAGRIGTYALIGALAGAFGQIALAAGRRLGVDAVIALAAGVAALLFGLAVAGRVPDPARLLTRAGLDVLIRGGAASAFRTPPYAAAILLGSLQGALPCALVYGAASRATVAGSASGGALTMLIFGLGTIPAIFALSSLSPSILARLRVWRWAGFFIVAVGLLLILRGLAGLGVVAHTLLW